MQSSRHLINDPQVMSNRIVPWSRVQYEQSNSFASLGMVPVFCFSYPDLRRSVHIFMAFSNHEILAMSIGCLSANYEPRARYAIHEDGAHVRTNVAVSGAQARYLA